jgi:hypothetical protein
VIAPERPSAAEPDLLRQHADVLFLTDPSGHLTAINEPDAEAPPRLFLARGRGSHLIRFRGDVPEQTVEACRAIAPELPPWTSEPSVTSLFEPLRVALGGHAPITSEERGPAFRFGDRVASAGDAATVLIDERSAHLLERHFPYTRSVLAWRSPVVGVVQDGWVVSACFSARKTSAAAEAGVVTEEPYRGRGLAPIVVSGWREVVEGMGAPQPLYSTSWDNAASLAVARKLRLIPYAETLSLG